MTEPAMLHQQLRERTSPNHQALEKKLVVQIKNIKTSEEYVSLLMMMYGYYASVETQLEKFLGSVPSLEFHGRRKAVSILSDIRYFSSVDNLPVCEELPAIQSDASALGAMYVLEGSTLGGKIIAAMIARQLDIANGEGLTFFLSYGDDTQRMWEKFKEHLAQPFPETAKEEIITAANSTFATFKNWIDQYAANQ